MSIKQKIKIKTFTGSGSIDFEKDQEDIMKIILDFCLKNVQRCK